MKTRLILVLVGTVALLVIGRGMASGIGIGELWNMVNRATNAMGVASGGLEDTAGSVEEATSTGNDIAGVVKDTTDSVRRTSGHDIPPGEIPPLPDPVDVELAARSMDTRELAYGDLPKGPGTVTPGDLDTVDALRRQSQIVGEGAARSKNRLEGYMYQEAGLLVAQQAAAARLHTKARAIRELTCQEELDARRRADEMRARLGVRAIEADDSLCAERGGQ